MEEVLAAPRQAVTIGVEMQTAGWDLEFHSHQKAQLMLSLSGVGTCEAEGGIWLVPPRSALFVPAGMSHRVAAGGRVECYNVFFGIAPKEAAGERVRAVRWHSGCPVTFSFGLARLRR